VCVEIAVEPFLRFEQELIRAGADLEVLDFHRRTPLADAIRRKKRDCAERLLDVGAKMSNVKADIEIPDWMSAIISKRENALQSLWAFLRVMRKRFHVEGQHIGNRLPRDLVGLISTYLWSTRFDERWASTTITK
jgi:hypothetical protein